MTHNIKEHWEEIHQTKNSDKVSWYQEKPQTSLNLIAEANLNKNSMIIDVGAGSSKLVDNLLYKGYKNITVLDISARALEKTKKRLGNKSCDVKWVVSDLMKFETKEMYDLWHDRAVFHFLTTEEDIKKYLNSVNQLLKLGGYLIISTFSINGPKKCSELNVKRYSEASMKKMFSNFEHIKSFEEKHITPFGTSQLFIYNMFRKRGDKK